MIQYCCDRCGNVFNISDNTDCTYDIVNNKESGTLDLCKKCYDELFNWLVHNDKLNSSCKLINKDYTAGYFIGYGDGQNARLSRIKE